MHTIDRILSSFSVHIVSFTLTIGVLILSTPLRIHAQTEPTSANSSQPDKMQLPEGDGKAIVEKSCSVCHELTNLTNAAKSEDDWRDAVQVMMERGASVRNDKVDILVKYLAKNFGLPPAAGSQAPPNPPAPPAARSGDSSQLMPEELPEGEGKTIATASCQRCHKLANLIKAHKSLDDWSDTVESMIDRGADVPSDKVDTLVQYLAKNFGPKAQ